MIWTIAWKNVWRNRTRSMVVIVAFTLGIFGSVYMVAFMQGMMDSRIQMAIGNEASHIQVHHPLYLENNELKYTIDNSPEIVSRIESIPEVKGVSPRIKVMGMASTSGNASGVIINGIEVENEKMVSGIATSILDKGGSFFEGDGRKPIVIGEKLARNLKLSYYRIDDSDLERMSGIKKFRDVLFQLDSIKDKTYRTELDFEIAVSELLGSAEAKKVIRRLKEQSVKYRLRRKIVLSFQSLDGNIAYDAFRVVGVYRTGNTGFDGLNVFVRNTDIAGVAAMQEGQVNQIAVLLYTADDDGMVAGKIKEMLPGMDVQTWEELVPEAAMYSSAMNYFMMIFVLIALLALGFGIVNTMLMAVLERVKELGMLMAVGMNRKKVFRMIMLETVFLGLTGGLIGLVISYLLILATGNSGIDLSSLYKEGFEAMGFAAKVFPSIGPETLAEIIVMVIITGILASIYPARKALKLNPSEALRVDM